MDGTQSRPNRSWDEFSPVEANPQVPVLQAESGGSVPSLQPCARPKQDSLLMPTSGPIAGQPLTDNPTSVLRAFSFCKSFQSS
jgi:hypothetical protein